MKKLITLVVTIYSTTLLASSGYDIQVESIEKTQMEAIFNLQDFNYEKVTLDCQGFINNVTVKQLNGMSERYILDYGECADIYKKLKSTLDLRMPACLRLYFQPYTYKVDKTYCK